MSKEMLKNISMLLVTLSIILVLFELAAKISYPFYANYNTEMWRYSSEIKEVSKHHGLSHEHKPYSKGYFYGTDVSINSDGFRDYEYVIKKDNSTFRSLLLGDSITFGWGVKFNETFAKLLEKRLNEDKHFNKYSKYDVINTGVGNYNTAMELVILNEKGLKYKPDLIILNYYINDVELSPQKPRLGILRYLYSYAFLWDKYQNAKVLFLKGNDYGTYYHKLYEGNFDGKENAKNALYQIIDIAKKNKIKILIVIYPEFHNFKNYEFDEVTRFVSDIAKSKNVSVLDLLPYYRNYKPEPIWVSFEDVHPNALGHQVAADAIYEKLINEGLLY